MSYFQIRIREGETCNPCYMSWHMCYVISYVWQLGRVGFNPFILKPYLARLLAGQGVAHPYPTHGLNGSTSGLPN